MSERKLTAKQARFVAEYLIDLNAAQAAIRAGYKPKAAKEMGYENLTKPHIRDAVNAARDALMDRLEISADKVLREVARCGFSDIRNYYDKGDL